MPGPAQPRWDAWDGLVPQQPVRFRTDARPCSRQLLDEVSRPSRPGAPADAPAQLLDVAGGIAQGYEPYLLDAGVFGSFLCARVATRADRAHRRRGSLGRTTRAPHRRPELVARLVAAKAAAAVAPAVLLLATGGRPRSPDVLVLRARAGVRGDGGRIDRLARGCDVRVQHHRA
jgi:hypothetical protein